MHFFRKMTAVAFIFATIQLTAATFYENDFEALGKLDFHGCFGPRWIGNLKTAEQEGHLKVHRMGLSEQGEKSHAGVMSYVLDITVDKSDGKWGGSCMFRSPALNIPLDKPVFLTGYVYPETLPPDIYLSLGVIFSSKDPKTGKTSGGSLLLPSRGVDSEGWLVFNEDVTKLVSARFPGAVMTGWMISIHAKKAFHGQRVKFYIDDVSVTDVQPQINITKDGVVRRHDILSTNPYTVNYLSYYREIPADAANVVFNSSFELGLKDWFPMVTRDTNRDKPGVPVDIPSPEKIFSVGMAADAPHGKNVFKIARNGETNRILVRSLPLKIRDGEDYVLSFYGKASKPTTLRVNSRQVTLGTTWKRHIINLPKIQCYQTWNKKKFPGRFELDITNLGDADIQLDAFQLQRAPLTDYKGHGIVQVAAKTNTRYGLFFPGTNPGFQVELFNDANEKRVSKVEWQIKDYKRDIIARGEKEIALEAGKGSVFAILPPEGFNHYTLYTTLKTAGQPEQTTVVSASRINDLRNLKNNEFFGACAIEGDNPWNLKDILEINKLLGVSFHVNYHTGYQSRAPKDWKKQNPQWQMIANVVDFSKRYGFETLLTNYDPFPAGTQRNAEGGEIVSQENLQDVYDYHKELASRFKGKIRYFETFAEYLKSPLEVKAVAADRMIRAASAGIKAGNPDAIFCAIGENKMDRGMLLSKMEALFKLGTLEFMDYITLHPYELGFGPEVHQTLAELKQLIRKYNKGKDKDILGTEAGIGGTDFLFYDDINAESLFYDRYMTELQQAESVIRSNIAMFASGMFRKNALFYPYNGKVTSRNSMYHFVIADNGIYPKTIFPATTTMVERLSGAIPAGEFEQRKANGLQGYFLKKNGKLSATLWIYESDHRFKNAIIPLPPEQLEAFNMVGEKIILKRGKNTILPLNGAAVYLQPKNIADDKFSDAMKNIRVENPVISMKVENGKLVAEIFNDTANELFGKLIFTPDGRTQEFRIPASGKRNFEIPPVNKNTVTAYSAEMDTAMGRFTSNKIRPLFCAKAIKKPLLDGSLKDFQNAVPVKLGEAHHVSLYQVPIRSRNDLAAELRFLYDDTNFYIAAEVTDDIHAVPHEHGSMIWANDALQLMFIMSGKLTVTSSTDILELAVSDTKNGALVSTTLLEQKMDLSKIKKVVKRSNGKTVYELAIPWSLLKPGFKPDNTVNPGFNLAVSDNDGRENNKMPKLKGYEKSLQMSKGLVDSKTPATALQLVFEK